MELAMNAITQNSDDNVISAGDSNVDSLIDSSGKTKIIELFASFGLKKIFDESSTITKISAKCINNILTNIVTSSSPMVTFNPHLSDHLAQKLEVYFNISETKEIHYYRDL
ncbi:hypothetical protein HHI36_003387, partial [Cryptolaemus montrouzieri]